MFAKWFRRICLIPSKIHYFIITGPVGGVQYTQISDKPKYQIPSGKQSQKTDGKDPPFTLMGKLTISTGPFSSSQTVDITRLGIWLVIFRPTYPHHIPPTISEIPILMSYPLVMSTVCYWKWQFWVSFPMNSMVIFPSVFGMFTRG